MKTNYDIPADMLIPALANRLGEVSEITALTGPSLSRQEQIEKSHLLKKKLVEIRRRHHS